MTHTTRTLTALTALVLVGGLAGCSTGTPDPTTAPATTTAPVAVETTAPVEPAPSATPEAVAPTAGPYDQVVNGVLYQGTEKAPVRVGTDAPGQAPAAEAGLVGVNRGGYEDYALGANKYLVYVSTADQGGWQWKLFGLDRFGSFRAVAKYGYSPTEPTFATAAEAAAGPFVADGRQLDRAEYMVFIEG